MREYYPIRDAFLKEHPWCEICQIRILHGEDIPLNVAEALLAERQAGLPVWVRSPKSGHLAP